MQLDVTTRRLPRAQRAPQSLHQVVVVPTHAPTMPRWLEAARTRRGHLLVLLIDDTLGAVCAVALALWWTRGNPVTVQVGVYLWTFVPFVIILMASRSMYRRRLNRTFLDEAEPVQTAVALATFATLSVVLWSEPTVWPSLLMLHMWVCAALLIPGVRFAGSLAQRWLRRRYRDAAPTVIIGSGPVAQQLITRMRQLPEYGLRPVGVLDITPPTDDEVLDVPYYGPVANLALVAGTTAAEEVIVAPSAMDDEQLALVAHRAQQLGLRVRVVPRLIDAMGGGARVEHLGGMPLVVLDHVDPRSWQFAAKHMSDRIAAAIGLLLISPLFLTLALLVKLSSPGPVFFAQERVGRDGKPFGCLKFRSMRPVDPSDEVFELKDGAAPGGVEGVDRRTPIGKIMRKTSMDELPQLINVVRGEMSLVGPRPERPEFVELFAIQVRRYGERHRVKAGMTGWAQVHGLRGQTSIADRAEFDNYYIENWSVLLDWKILVLTVFAVLRPTED